jgi:hypothetical protein
MAEDNLTALAEATLSGTPVAPGHHPPKVVFSATVNLESVLDLTQGSVQTALGTSIKELQSNWRLATATDPLPPTQLLGRLTYQGSRYMAIRYLSLKQPGGICMAIFTDRLRMPFYVEIHDPDGNIKGRIP